MDSLTIVTRWWKELDYLEVTWTAGPIDIEDGLGKELALKYDTNLSTGSTFYTDANGRELQKRILDYRPSWDLKVEEPVSGNYYPLTAAIAVKASIPSLAVLFKLLLHEYMHSRCMRIMCYSACNNTKAWYQALHIACPVTGLCKK